MLKGFKDFLMRGNVVDLAVAVIIGTAFTAIVTAIADSFIKPLIAAFGGANVTGLSWTIVSGNPGSRIDFAAIITAIINFLIVAGVVYFLIVMPMKRLQERRKRGEDPDPSEPTDVELLTEIRDLLRQQQQPVQGYAQQPNQAYPQETHQAYPQETHQTYPQEARQGYPQETRQGYPQESRQGYPQQSRQQPPRPQQPPQPPRPTH